MHGALLLAMWAASTASAAEEASYPSSPPLSIDDAETVERGHIELNVTAGFSGGRAGWEAETPLVDANLGVTDDIHLNAELPYVLAADGGGPPPRTPGTPRWASPRRSRRRACSCSTTHRRRRRGW